jgi:hypothetical protein
VASLGCEPSGLIGVWAQWPHWGANQHEHGLFMNIDYPDTLADEKDIDLFITYFAEKLKC